MNMIYRSKDVQKTGQINRIDPTGGYPGKFGYVYTFQMTIQTASGQIVGEIGSKSERYPMNAGDQITVEATDGDHGTKFKKFDPQHQQGQQGSSQPHQSTNKEPDWDAIAEGKCRSLVVQAAVQSLQMECKNFNDVDRLVKYMMNGQRSGASANVREFEQQYDLPQGDKY